MTAKLAVLALLLVAIVYYYSLHQEGGGVAVGEIAPSFALPSRAGTASLEQYRGKAVLINFWATWCPPCVEEMPSLERLRQLTDGKNFEILAINLDGGGRAGDGLPGDGWAVIDDFAGKIPTGLTILLDGDGEVADLYGTSRLPESYLVGRNGVVVKKYVGPKRWDDPAIVREILQYAENR